MTEREIELIAIINDLDLMLEKFCIIQDIPEFDENKNKPIWIRFRNHDDVYLYISIMKRYRQILDELDYYEYVGKNPKKEIIYNVDFIAPGWYRGYLYTSKYEKKDSNIVEYKYEFDGKFNDLIREMQRV